MSAAVLPPDVFGSAATIADPYPVYRALQHASPVLHARGAKAGASGAPGEPCRAWALLRHREVLAAIRDPDMFSPATPQLQAGMPRLERVRSALPRRTHLWNLVNDACSARRISALAGWIRQSAGALLDAAGGGLVELMAAYAIPLSTQTMTGMLGFPGEDAARFAPWCKAGMAHSCAPSPTKSRELEQFVAYMSQAIAARRADPREDLLSALVGAEIEGQPLPDEEIRCAVAGVVVSSSEGAANCIGNMMGLLADRPELFRRAREDRSLVEPIVEEALRYESPMQHFSRVTTRAVEVSGVEIPAGELVELCCGAANRDPEVFEEPDRFWPERPTNREHLSFGRGSRYCAGAPLIRLLARISLDTFLDRLSSLGRGASAPRRQQAARVALGYASLPLVLKEA